MLSSDYIMLNIATLCTMSTLWFIEQFHSHSCLYKDRAGQVLPPVYRCSY